MIVPIGVFHLARSASSLAAYYEDRLETAGAQDRAQSVLTPPVPAEAGSVPSHEGLGADNRDGLDD